MPDSVARRRSSSYAAPLLAALVLALLATPAGAVVGPTTPGSVSDSDSPGHGEAFRAKAGATGGVDRLSVYLDGGSTASVVEVGLYSSGSGKPKSRLARCVVGSPVAGKYNSCSVSPVNVTSGTSYWLGILQPASSTGTLRFRISTGSGASYGSSESSLTSLPGTWSAGTYWGAQTLSAYADQASAATPPPAPKTQCADGVDNDADGKIDYPADPGCASASDDSESPDPAPTPPPPGSPTLTPPDGGSSFFSQFSPSLPSDPGFVPISVWLESVTSPGDVATDKDAGLNTYLAITANSTLSYIRDAGGMYVLPHDDEWRGRMGGLESGIFGADEYDMNYGPGPGLGGSGTGYTRMQQLEDALPPSALWVTHYGKGVEFWETDAQAAKFVNDWGDVVSADIYWMTDTDACLQSQGGGLLGYNRDLTSAECHRPANYGASVQRVRDLNASKGAAAKPTWGIVEVGCPMGSGLCIKPPEIRAAVWHSFIAGARGLVYFNHSFSGPCQSQHDLRDSCYAAARAVVKDTNAQIRSLAPVLNAPFVTSGWTANSGVKAMVKWSGGSFYVFAGSAGSGTTGSFSIPCVGAANATVLGENRSVPVAGGAFSDAFADGNAIHIYRIDGGSSCGLA